MRLSPNYLRQGELHDPGIERGSDLTESVGIEIRSRVAFPETVCKVESFDTKFNLLRFAAKFPSVPAAGRTNAAGFRKLLIEPSP